MATVEDIPQHVSQAILHLTDLGKVNARHVDVVA